MADIVFVADSPAVVVELVTEGSHQKRLRAAAKAVAALGSAGLGVMAEGGHGTEDMESYLADGQAAEVYELPEETARRA